MLQQRKTNVLRALAIVLAVGLTPGCALFTPNEKPEVVHVKASSLLENNIEEEIPVNTNDDEKSTPETKIEKVESLAHKTLQAEEVNDEAYFKNNQTYAVAFDSLRVTDFIHQTFGNTLKVNYVIEQKISNIPNLITLNISKGLTDKQLYKATKQLLDENGVKVRLKEGVFYLHTLDPVLEGAVVQVGRSVSSVPQTTGTILQIIPLKYGVNFSIERTLKQLVKAKVSPDAGQSALFVEGTREQVIQVIELTELLDRPAHQGKNIGFIELNYISTEEFIETISELLTSEGIPADLNNKATRNLAMVPIEQIGAIAIFASELDFLNRVEFWAKKLDQPPKGDTKQYFIYRPKFARAEDIGESLAPLFGGNAVVANKSGNNSRDTKSSVANKTQGKSSLATSNGGLDEKGINIVIDSRANFVIVHATGSSYQGILPLIKNLDVMPKQILLDVTIAEVTLRDEFQYGVEFFLESGKFSLSTQGVMGLDDISGGLFKAAGAVSTIEAKAIERNSLVNILSNPTLLVRDGATASIVVGDEIPIVTSTDTNDNTEVVRENVERRQTGLTLSVVPTINTNGVVIMDIQQSISNQIAGNAQGILNRDISTEVVANSGKTILLGGLVSENAYDIDKGVPFLSSIPIFGYLFKSETQSKEKTELVVLVTPRIIFDDNQWDNIKHNFKQGLDMLTY
ncbi:secretin N-terminal domain-containing protein [Litorilituus lipolyticus]|uniref:Uncharacterized protein n=1 Tax=Litorilituus lipolyticus TaxID=2491017 RepID=A0A502LGD5_9GAMM|nr:secretin N-terminal domain-containing protein [Litorilituus lipolyticus]TPH18967.1 hypothetical protein EPA86_01335 [Litorilituus lipolyticus]